MVHELLHDSKTTKSSIYLSLEGMLSCVNNPPDHYCTACWSGKYRIPIDHAVSKFSSEKYQQKLFD